MSFVISEYMDFREITPMQVVEALPGRECEEGFPFSKVRSSMWQRPSLTDSANEIV